MSSADLVLMDLKAGMAVRTSNMSCAKYFTNQVPDAIRKLRNRGIKIETKLVPVERNGRVTRVAEYRLV